MTLVIVHNAQWSEDEVQSSRLLPIKSFKNPFFFPV
uniref:Uncharacterized protein n=1 Tax=Anguilla anguilla TaxID=7936 RepID=A0A0E9P883_ANGAN